MKKSISIVAAVALFAIMGMVAGCSSAAKVSDEQPSASIVQAIEPAPANLGASSSGRGL